MNVRCVLLLTVTSWLLSCDSPHDRKNNQPDTAKSSRADTAGVSRPTEEDGPALSHPLDTVLSFAGVWVNQVYFDRLARNRSPRLDQGIDQSCINIPARTLIETRMIAGFHDGAGSEVVVKIGNRYQFYDPSLKLPLDTIEPLSNHRLRIGTQFFRQIDHADTLKSDWGILEDLLFSGMYVREDGDTAVFGRDGHIKGLETVSFFEPVIDYADRADRQVDLVRLGQSRKEMDDFGFQFKKDTLFIYTIDYQQSNAGESGFDSTRFGTLMWKLRRLP